jgi:hypothetical protein
MRYRGLTLRRLMFLIFGVVAKFHNSHAKEMKKVEKVNQEVLKMRQSVFYPPYPSHLSAPSPTPKLAPTSVVYQQQRLLRAVNALGREISTPWRAMRKLAVLSQKSMRDTLSLTRNVLRGVQEVSTTRITQTLFGFVSRSLRALRPEIKLPQPYQVYQGNSSDPSSTSYESREL